MAVVYHLNRGTDFTSRLVEISVYRSGQVNSLHFGLGHWLKLGFDHIDRIDLYRVVLAEFVSLCQASFPILIRERDTTYSLNASSFEKSLHHFRKLSNGLKTCLRRVRNTKNR